MTTKVVTPSKINSTDLTVLRFLAANMRDGFAYNFDGIASEIRLTRRQVKCACRKLRRFGYAALVYGLMDDDGKVAGARYRATQTGVEFAATIL